MKKRGELLWGDLYSFPLPSTIIGVSFKMIIEAVVLNITLLAIYKPFCDDKERKLHDADRRGADNQLRENCECIL